MELRQLRAFLEVANLGHFGRAATVLKITQPALTQRIQALERELNVQLLTRSAREVRLTSAGEVLLPYARSLVQVEDRALRELAENAAGRAGRLRISYHSLGDTVTQSKIVARFRECYPRVVVETTAGHSEANIERLASGEVDAAFLATPIAPRDAVEVRPIAPFELVLALPLQHRLAKLDRVPVRELRGEPLVLTPLKLNRALNGALRNWLTSRTGGELNLVAEEPPDQAIQAFVNSGAASAIVTSSISSTAVVADIAYRSLKPAPLITLAIAYLRDDPSPVLANLLRVIDEVSQSLSVQLPDDGEPI